MFFLRSLIKVKHSHSIMIDYCVQYNNFSDIHSRLYILVHAVMFWERPTVHRHRLLKMRLPITKRNLF